MDLQQLEELANEELRFKKFTFVGNDRVLVSGNLRTGFAVNINEIGGVTDETLSGGCCLPNTLCIRTTEAKCTELEGTYQGDGAPCTPFLCVNCPLPEGDCPHSICAEFMLDSEDTSTGDIIHFSSDAFDTGDRMGFYFDGTNWNLYVQIFDSTFVSDAILAVDPFETWHSATIQITYTGSNTIHIAWEVDGVTSSFDATWMNCYGTTLKIGTSFFGSGDAHRTIRSVSLLVSPSHPPTENASFNFPSAPFDSLTTGASIVGGQLRIDSVGGIDAYGEKDFVPGIDIQCCCCAGFRDVTEITGFDLTYDFSGSYPSYGDPPTIPTCPGWSVSGTHIFSFTRINLADTFDDDQLQFKMWVSSLEDGCLLNIVGNHFSPSGIRFNFPAGSVCSLIVDVPSFEITNPVDRCEGIGSISFNVADGSVSVWHNEGEICRCPDPNTPGCTTEEDCFNDECSTGPRCAEVFCGPGAPMVSIPFNIFDLSSIIGTYSSENTCSASICTTSGDECPTTPPCVGTCLDWTLTVGITMDIY